MMTNWIYGRPYCLPIFNSLTSAADGAASETDKVTEARIETIRRISASSRYRRHLLGIEREPGAGADFMDFERRCRDTQPRAAFGQGDDVIPEFAEISTLRDRHRSLRPSVGRLRTRQPHALRAHRECRLAGWRRHVECAHRNRE